MELTLPLHYEIACVLLRLEAAATLVLFGNKLIPLRLNGTVGTGREFGGSTGLSSCNLMDSVVIVIHWFWILLPDHTNSPSEETTGTGVGRGFVPVTRTNPSILHELRHVGNISCVKGWQCCRTCILLLLLSR